MQVRQFSKLVAERFPSALAVQCQFCYDKTDCFVTQIWWYCSG